MIRRPSLLYARFAVFKCQMHGRVKALWTLGTRGMLPLMLDGKRLWRHLRD